MRSRSAASAADDIAATADDPYPFVADWLAALFIRPLPPAALPSFEDGPNAAVLGYLDKIDDFRPGVAAMRAALASETSNAARERRLTTAFTLLFDGPGGPDTVPPYASAFPSAPADQFQDPRGEMQALLRRHDISVGSTLREPADHIAIELAALAHLCRLGSAGMVDTLRLVAHLRNWAPAFAKLCAGADRSGFYAGGGAVLVALVTPDAMPKP